jgi:cell division protease FtsH
MDELHRLSAILIERETIDKDQFLRLLEGASQEEVFPEETPSTPEAETPKERRPAPKPKPFPVPGAMMQPPPPDPAKS